MAISFPRRFASLATLACGACLLVFFLSRTVSRAAGSGLSLEYIVQYLDSSGQPRFTDTLHELVRLDGSRSIARLRSVMPKGNGPVDIHHSRTIYIAATNTTYDAFPEVGMFGRVPIGKGRYNPLTSLVTCAGMFHSGDNVSKGATSTKFGKTVESYVIERTSKMIQETITTEVFPEFGCLKGDENSELRNITTGIVFAANVQKIVSLDTVPDDPTQFTVPPPGLREGKPSDLLRKSQELEGKDCPQCLLNTGSRADERYETLWKS